MDYSASKAIYYVCGVENFLFPQFPKYKFQRRSKPVKSRSSGIDR